MQIKSSDILWNTPAPTGNVVNVKSFGATGDGTTDDTDAIEAALEYANGIASGKWETEGDTDYPNTIPTRNRQPLFFPTGVYLTKRTIPINYFGVSITGPPSPVVGGLTNTCDYGGAIILADHDDSVFEVNNDYNFAWAFGLQYIGLRKPPDHQGVSQVGHANHGVSIIGANWNAYTSLYGVSIRHLDNAINISTGSIEIGHLTIERCQLALNAGYGIDSDDFLCLASIRSNDMAQNGAGGIRSVHGTKNALISGNNLEGQPSPITIAAHAHSLTIMNNYAEVISVGTACIDINYGYNFRVFGNCFESAVTIPHVNIDNSSQGCVEQDIDKVIVTNSTDVKVGWL